MAGRDPGFISSGKAECPLTDKNKVGMEKTRKREMNRVRAKMRELPWQRRSCYGSVDDFG